MLLKKRANVFKTTEPLLRIFEVVKFRLTEQYLQCNVNNFSQLGLYRYGFPIVSEYNFFNTLFMKISGMNVFIFILH